jgi:hypothetical protein
VDPADRYARGVPPPRFVVCGLAAPAFAAALLEREVIGTIAVDRRVLVIAEVPIEAGSELDGQPLAR